MKFDSPVSFEQRYQLRNQLWYDGPHSGWHAFDTLLKRDVIVHQPYRSSDDQRFLQMAQQRARLRHANLVPVYDLGTTSQGNPFFTEPHFLGTDLLSLLRDNAPEVTLPRLVSYLLDIGKAVAYLHANELLHLELRPGNVRVVPAFHEVFVELGHRSLTPMHVVTVEVDAMAIGSIARVPAYMAPEQADPEKFGAADELTDVYGLGGILFEVLYEAPPNARKPTSLDDILSALVHRKGPPERGTFGRCAIRHRELARKLEPLCLRALESNRTARPTSVSVLMKELEQLAWE